MSAFVLYREGQAVIDSRCRQPRRKHGPMQLLLVKPAETLQQFLSRRSGTEYQLPLRCNDRGFEKLLLALSLLAELLHV